MELSSCMEESRSDVTHRRRARRRGENSYSSGMCHGDNLNNVLKRSLSGQSAFVFHQSISLWIIQYYCNNHGIEII